jgi:hypothetical protein
LLKIDKYKEIKEGDLEPAKESFLAQLFVLSGCENVMAHIIILLLK